jgi:CubicO group peptidase (beta-lactamase class C family)
MECTTYSETAHGYRVISITFLSAHLCYPPRPSFSRLSVWVREPWVIDVPTVWHCSRCRHGDRDEGRMRQSGVLLSRRAILGGLASIAVTGCASHRPARIQTSDVFADLQTVLRAYVERVQGKAVVLVGAGPRLIHATSFHMQVGDAVTTASLSKPITALAIATLVQAGKLSFDDTLAVRLGGLLQRYGPPADPQVGTITVRQLVTHTSGLWPNDEHDPLLGTPLQALRAHGGQRRLRKEHMLEPILATRLIAPPGERYAYSNAGYLLLGCLIEAVSGRPYDAYCLEAVLRPMGVGTATIDPLWRFAEAAVGWRLSAPAYLRVFRAFEADEPRILGPAMHRFVVAHPGTWVHPQRRSYYTLGLVVREVTPGAFSWWHTNRIRTPDGQGSSAAVVSRNSEGTSLFWYIAPHPPQHAEGHETFLTEMDRQTWQALRAWKGPWPQEDLFPQYGF